ncbi:hypothetical protein HW114_10100 [Serratia symbiotica]|uniref:DUF4875 domain-containing protein n=1 Tax=Serratia symbiotica TaxID=138074 RepID=UPI001322BE88|nr:hypothetical protein [Serratia symbiotica]MBF1995815.1 hypothetical protein [Serratia symbiotica]QTP13792.1 hypothetical protein GPZ83_0010160 [Serratia symbiotica]
MHTKYLLTLIASVALSVCSFFSQATAVPYKVLQDTNTSIGTKRIRSYIAIVAPTAHDKTSRADTVKQAIEDRVNKSHAVVVTAMLVPSKDLLGAGALLAKGEYYADGCGASGSECGSVKLNLSASDIILSDKSVRIWEQSVKSSNELAERGILTRGK